MYETIGNFTFDEGSSDYTADRDKNLAAIKMAERHLNDLVRLQGYLTVDDICRVLDITLRDDEGSKRTYYWPLDFVYVDFDVRARGMDSSEAKIEVDVGIGSL